MAAETTRRVATADVVGSMTRGPVGRYGRSRLAGVVVVVWLVPLRVGPS